MFSPVSFYRVWKYSNSVVPFKHCYMKRERSVRKGMDDRASCNVAAILEELKKLDAEQDEDEFSKLSNNLSRSRKTIVDLILCNRFEYFCTFTFDSSKIDRYNYDVCQKKLRKFFNNFKTRYAPDFKYLIIPEFHKDGAIHFHGLCSGFPDGELTVPDKVYKRTESGEVVAVPNTKGYTEWRRYHKAFGFFNCSRIANYNACAFYVSKYVTKNLLEIGKGRAVYMCSLGLARPELVFDFDDMPCVFTPEYENAYCAVSFQRSDLESDFSVMEYNADCADIFDSFCVADSASASSVEELTGEQLVMNGYNKSSDWWEKYLEEQYRKEEQYL